MNFRYSELGDMVERLRVRDELRLRRERERVEREHGRDGVWLRLPSGAGRSIARGHVLRLGPAHDHAVVRVVWRSDRQLYCRELGWRTRWRRLWLRW